MLAGIVVIGWNMICSTAFGVLSEWSTRSTLMGRGVRVEATLVSHTVNKRFGYKQYIYSHLLVLEYAEQQKSFSLDDPLYRVYQQNAEYLNMVVYDPQNPRFAMLAYDLDHGKSPLIAATLVLLVGLFFGIVVPLAVLWYRKASR